MMKTCGYNFYKSMVFSLVGNIMCLSTITQLISGSLYLVIKFIMPCPAYFLSRHVMKHLTLGLLPSSLQIIWFSKYSWLFPWNVHLLQRNWYDSCTNCMCAPKQTFCVKTFSHWLQWNIILECVIIMGF